MKLVLSVFVLAMMMSCGGSDQMKQQADPESVAVYEPKWYGMTDKNYYTGYAVAESKDRQLASSKAKSSAMNEIAQQMEVRNQGLMKQFKDETGIGEDAELLATATEVIKQTTSSVLSGLEIAEREMRQKQVNGKRVYISYIKVTVPKAEIANALLKKLKAKKDLYTKFQASKGFKELEEEAKKMEEYKEKNM